jgi:hypothetical protein
MDGYPFISIYIHLYKGTLWASGWLREHFRASKVVMCYREVGVECMVGLWGGGLWVVGCWVVGCWVVGSGTCVPG